MKYDDIIEEPPVETQKKYADIVDKPKKYADVVDPNVSTPIKVPPEVKGKSNIILPGQEITAKSEDTGPLTSEEIESPMVQGAIRKLPQAEPIYQPGNAPTEGTYAGQPAPIPVERVPELVTKGIEQTIQNQPIVKAAETAAAYPGKLNDFLNYPFKYGVGDILDLFVGQPLEVALGAGVSATPTGALFQSGQEALRETAPEIAKRTQAAISPVETLYGDTDFGKKYPQLLKLGDVAFQGFVFKLAHMASNGEIKLAPKEKTGLENIVRTEVTRNYSPEEVTGLMDKADKGEQLTAQEQDLVNAVKATFKENLPLGESFLSQAKTRGAKVGQAYDVTPIEQAGAKYEKTPNSKYGPEMVRDILRTKAKVTGGAVQLGEMNKELPIDRSTQSEETRPNQPISPEAQNIIDEIAKDSPTSAATIKSKLETGRADEVTPGEKNLMNQAAVRISGKEVPANPQALMKVKQINEEFQKAKKSGEPYDMTKHFTEENANLFGADDKATKAITNLVAQVQEHNKQFPDKESEPEVEKTTPPEEVQEIPPSARKKLIADLGGKDVETQFGSLGDLSDQDLIRYAKEKGKYQEATSDESNNLAGQKVKLKGIPDWVTVTKHIGKDKIEVDLGDGALTEVPRTEIEQLSTGKNNQAAIESLTKEKVSSTQVNLPTKDAKPFIDYANAIPEDKLYTEEGEEYGRETEPHVTALFGLREHNPSEVAKIVKDFGDIKLTFGKTSIFTNDKYDVLKVDVKSDKMHKLNELLQKLPHKESDHPDYKPHLTIAYLKKGEGKNYVGDKRFEGKTVTISELLHSNQEHEKTALPLSAAKPPVKAEKPAKSPYTVEVGGKSYPIPSLEEASKKWEQFRDKGGYGSTKLASAGMKPVIKDASGKQIGYVAYNGRIFAGKEKDWTPETKLLYENRKPAEQEKPVTSQLPSDPAPKGNGASLYSALGPGLDPETVRAVASDVSSLFSKAKNSEVRQRVHDFVTVDPIPKLSRHPVAGDAAVEHASAKLAAPFIVDDMLSKVFPYEYDNPEAMSQTIDILNKDNILAGYDEMLQREQDARQKGDDKLAEKWAKGAENISTKHDLDEYEQVLKDTQSDPAIVANIERWKEFVNPPLNEMYNVVKGVDPETERTGRGKYFDARINLLPSNRAEEWQKFMKDDRAPIPAPSASSYRNPNVKHDPYDRAAKFTGDYSTDARLVLLSVVGQRYNEATKIRFYDSLVNSGVAVKGDKGVEAPTLIQGKPVSRLAIKLPHTSEEGKTRQVEEVLYVRKDLVREIRSVLGTDMPVEQNPVAKLLTSIQLAQIADAVTHAKNIQTTVARAQGAGSAWMDVVRKLPIFNTADALYRIIQAHREVMADTPQMRAEIASMAKEGLVRPQYPPSGLQKITGGQRFLHKADTASRVIMNRFFDNLVERDLAKDTPANRRKYINQVGQYNSRLMGQGAQVMRNLGLSPFIVAGRNYNRQARWSLTGNPGVESTGPAASAQLRLTNLLGLALMFTIPMMLNMLTSGSPTGREGTPLGEWDMGDDSKTGKRRVFDLLQITGVRRGMRVTGVEPLLEGIRAGQTANQIGGQMVEGVGQSVMHPWIGPGLGFMSKTITGRQLDMRGQLDAVQLPEGGMNQYVENFRAALAAQNPLVYSMVRPVFQKSGLETEDDKPYLKGVGSTFLQSPAGAVGIKTIYPTEKGWELAMRNILKSRGEFFSSPEEKALRAKRKEFVTRAKTGEITDEDIKQAAEQGLINKQTIDQFLYTPQILTFKRLGLHDAIDIYNMMPEKTQQEYYPILEQKVLNSKEYKEFIASPTEEPADSVSQEK